MPDHPFRMAAGSRAIRGNNGTGGIFDMLETVIVWVLVGLAALYVVRHIYRRFSRKDPCASCGCSGQGCPLSNPGPNRDTEGG
ncbi:FeoB-associated Cys-rich membrane protein [Desulfatiglans anilini]|uniref:FeoB-associated Cys-rich membrane protein n=1 Tax=Desulfatiglans anilini TaxID=90728 RepID=UPI000485ED47|nr:FeoB-associated Cys-rich membrane protein [Desulfatiglans anilini]